MQGGKSRQEMVQWESQRNDRSEQTGKLDADASDADAELSDHGSKRNSRVRKADSYDPSSCTICDKVFASDHHRKRHETRMHSAKEDCRDVFEYRFSCTFCGQVFASDHDRKLHETFYHSAKEDDTMSSATFLRVPKGPRRYQARRVLQGDAVDRWRLE